MRLFLVLSALALTACDGDGVRYGVGASIGPGGVSPTVSASNGTFGVTVSP